MTTQKLKKLELNDFKLFAGYNEIKFKNQTTIIVGNNDSGKTILFNSIKDRLASNKYENNCVVGTNFENLIEKNTEWLFGMTGMDSFEELLYEKYDAFLNYTVIEKMNVLLKQYLKFPHNFILDESKKLQVIGTDNLTSTEILLVNLCYLFAVKSYLYPKSFFILDIPLGAIPYTQRKQLMKMILNNSEQVILLVTHISDIDNENIFGKNYQKILLDYNLGQTKIKQFA